MEVPVGKAAENGIAGGCFRCPFYRALTRGPRRFKLVLCSCAKAFYSFESLRAGYFLTFFPPLTLSQATYFGSSTSDAEMDFSRSLAEG